RVFFERPGENVRLEQVDAHRRERDPGRAGRADRLFRLFLEADHPPGLVDADDAETAAFFGRNLDGRQRDVRAAIHMEAQHLRVIHLVDVITREDEDVRRFLAFDGIEVLIDGVGRAEVPVLAHALLWRQDFDELAELFGYDVPAHSDVPVQRERLVL